MLRITFFCGVLLCSARSLSAAEIPVDPVITEVTVYRAGAKVSSNAKVTLPAGQSEVVFRNLSQYLNANSLQVRIKGGALLNSATVRYTLPEPSPENPRIRGLRDSLQLLSDDFVRLRDEREVLEQEAELLENNISRVGTSSGNNGERVALSPIDLQAAIKFYRERALEIRKRQLELTIQERAYKIQETRMSQRLRQLEPNTGLSTYAIVLKIDAPSAQTAEITCTYLVNNASWSPLYDLRAENLEKPLRLTYRANVRNQTGFDWKNVRLHLSSATPFANNDRPILSPVFLDFQVVAQVAQKKEDAGQVLNSYQLNQSNMADRRSSRNMAELSAPAEEVVAPEVPVVDAEAPDNADLLTTFDLAQLQTVLSDGKENLLTVDELDMPAVFEYHTVPKLDNGVFLLAKVADYGKYNLLPGIANLFYQDTYVGQNTLNPQTTSDTLRLSLGRDEQIMVKRVKPRDFTERRKILSNSIRETYAYEIIIKNNKSVPIRIDVLDQIPLSKQKEIEVELLEKDGAAFTEEYGKLLWTLNIPAGKNEQRRFSYAVKYPKGRDIGTFRN